MTPDFKIIADATDVTAAIRSRLMSLSVTDAAGLDSDTLELVLDDRDAALELPRTGAALEVHLGYKETGLTAMGRYVADEVVLAGSPATMTIRGHAADLRAQLKAPRTRPWDQVTIGAIVTTIAGEHGYTARVATELAQIAIAHIDQTDESDLHFLTRLAGEHGAIAKPAADMLLFVPRGQAKTASGKDMEAVTLAATDLSTWSVTLAERGKYAAVSARWHDAATAEEHTITVGSGEPAYTIGRRYPDEQATTAAAKARLAAFARGLGVLRFTCPGDVRLGAEGQVVLTGIRDGAAGPWILNTVTHRYDDSGYHCDCDGQNPDK